MAGRSVTPESPHGALWTLGVEKGARWRTARSRASCGEDLVSGAGELPTSHQDQL
jgi:hypothetical protein